MSACIFQRGRAHDATLHQIATLLIEPHRKDTSVTRVLLHSPFSIKRMRKQSLSHTLRMLSLRTVLKITLLIFIISALVILTWAGMVFLIFVFTVGSTLLQLWRRLC